MTDPNFRRSVLLLIDHGETGSLGLIINRPTPISVIEVMPELSRVIVDPQVVFQGGPVQPEVVLAIGSIDLHQLGEIGESINLITDSIASYSLASDIQELSDRVSQLRIFSGYAGWHPGQLIDEIRAGAWFVVEGNDTDVLSENPQGMWSHVLRRQSSDLAMLANYPEELYLN
jgi:putative transcriptional regulator